MEKQLVDKIYRFAKTNNLEVVRFSEYDEYEEKNKTGDKDINVGFKIRKKEE